jgi:hypothetical protein
MRLMLFASICALSLLVLLGLVLLLCGWSLAHQLLMDHQACSHLKPMLVRSALFSSSTPMLLVYLQSCGQGTVHHMPQRHI